MLTRTQSMPADARNLNDDQAEYAEDFAAVREAVKQEIEENERLAKENAPTEEQLRAIRF